MTLTLNDRSTAPAATAAGTPSRRPRRLSRRGHRTALIAHVLTSVGWFGIAIIVVFCDVTARTTGDPALSRALYETVRTTLWLSVPVGLAAAATGVLLSLTTRWGLVRHWWVVAKEAITLVVIVTDVVVVGPVMANAIDSGTNDDPQPLVAHCVLLTIATVLSIVKPRGRTPLASRQARPGRDV